MGPQKTRKYIRRAASAKRKAAAKKKANGATG